MTCGPNLLRIIPAMLLGLLGCGGEASAAQPSGPFETGTPEFAHAPLPADDAGPHSPASSAGSSAPASSAPPAADTSTTPDLGPLPPELAALTWPARPRITREVTARTMAELEEAVATPGTRVTLVGVQGGDLDIRANDIELVADASSSLGRLAVTQGIERVRVEGGRWGPIHVEVPADFSSGQASYDPALMARDLSFESMTIDSGGTTAFEIRGQRIAAVGNDVTTGSYSVWCGDTGHFQSEDIILFDNVFRSGGEQSTVRLVSVRRSATVSNVLSNPHKHNYRVHGVSDLAVASDNLLVGAGVMMGTMEGDRLERVWFDDNVIHHDAPDLFNPAPGIRALSASRNMTYCDTHPEFFEGDVQSGWTMSENQIAPYQAPPAF